MNRLSRPLLALFVLLLATPAFAQNEKDEPEPGTPEWADSNLVTLTYSSIGLRLGGKGFDNLNLALRDAGYAGVPRELWALSSGGATLIKNSLYIGFEAHILFSQVSTRGGSETFVPVFEVPLSSVAAQFNLGWNVLRNRSRRVRLIPTIGGGWGLTRVMVEPESQPAVSFAQGLTSPSPVVRLRQTYWFAHPQLLLHFAPKPDRKNSFFFEARVGYLLAGDREWNDRYARLTDAPSDNPSALTVSLAVGLQMRGRSTSGLGAVMQPD